MAAVSEFKPSKHVTPIQNGELMCKATSPWFVDGSEYTPKLASFKTLVNGQEAFGDVYRAIERAKKSVSIICWGFQPSMYFIRDGQHLMIGELLEKKAREGVMVRVLCWAFQPTDNTVANLTGVPLGLDESNTPGRWDIRLWSKPPSSSDAQYQYDKKFFRIYDRKQSIAGALNRDYVISDSFPKEKLLFTSRSYTSEDRKALEHIAFADRELAEKTKKTLKGYPSHHQKMVLVDHEDPDRAVGFVMGHNMLDPYWDTSDHGWKAHQPNAGRNGSTPRHDYSSRVTGPIVGDLFGNFKSAWKKETGQELAGGAFPDYPIRGQDPRAMCQILRTQPQHEKQDIKKCYLQATNNATQYIHIENQYFRWPPLAEKIKACAAKMAQWGRTPERDGSLYLFVITNSTDAGMGVGTVNTYRMLDSLGRADRLPEVARDQRLKDVDAQLAQVNKESMQLLARSGTAGAAANTQSRLEALDTRRKQLNEARARLEPQSLRERVFGSDRTPEAIKQANIPGLKAHIATLVAPDTPAGEEWPEVYIHAKLMLIDDAFMTLGSANINTRSMQTDSELNIAHHVPAITRPLREQQWAKYTAGRVTGGMSFFKTFGVWQKIMNDNAELKNAGSGRPIAQLAEFLRTSDKISNSD